MFVAGIENSPTPEPVVAVPFLRRRPYLFILLGGVIFSLLNLLNDSPFLPLGEIEWHDTISQWFILSIMLGWVAITHQSKVNELTYNRFVCGCACLIWLMTIKFFGELYERQTSILTTFELLLAVLGLLLVTLGLLSWSREFQQAIENLSTSTSKYRELSEKDPLTGLFNRRQFDAIIAHLAGQGDDLSLVIVDLDNFKTINDTHGHPVGDAVIERAAEILRTYHRDTDYAFRMGGDEFALLYVNCPRTLVVQRSEKIRESLVNESFSTCGQLTLTVTASLGVAHLEDRMDPATLYPQADAALYEAKSRGRAQVVVA